MAFRNQYCPVVILNSEKMLLKKLSKLIYYGVSDPLYLMRPKRSSAIMALMNRIMKKNAKREVTLGKILRIPDKKLLAAEKQSKTL
jgi:hypothetical protein